MSEQNKEQTSECMLTTIDNPYNPFDNFDGWNQFDQAKGYNTLAYLGRIVDYRDCVTEEDKRKEREESINQIIHLDPLQIYCKVYANEVVKPIQIELKEKEN